MSRLPSISAAIGPWSQAVHGNASSDDAYRFFLITMIWSKPNYVPLAWDREGHTHLLAAHGEGGECLLRLLADSPHGTVAVRYAIDSLGANDCSLRLTQKAGTDFQAFNTIALLLAGMRSDLATGRMGLRLYLAGSE